MKLIYRLLLISGLLTPGFSQAIDAYPFQSELAFTLSLGDLKTLKSNEVERIAVGNEDIITVNILENDEILILPIAVGSSDLIIWHKGNRKTMIHIAVTNVDNRTISAALNQVLLDFPYLTLTETDHHYYVGGQISQVEKQRLEEQLEASQLSRNVSLQLRENGSQLVSDITRALADFPELELQIYQDRLAISGKINPNQLNQFKQLKNAFPLILDMTMENPAPAKAMIQISVRILEIKSRKLSESGINWSNIIAGPGLLYAGQSDSNPYFSIINPEVLGVESMPPDIKGVYTSFGASGSLQSSINLLTEKGFAKTLANPILSTAENTQADFHVGGEIPYPVMTEEGNTAILFRPYGILLSVEPRLGTGDNIEILFNAEVTSIDQAVTVNGMPGLATRKVSSIAYTKEKQTVVISGLVSNEQNKNHTGLPLISQIPVLGRLFKARSQDFKETELVILLTPEYAHSDTTQLNTFSNQLSDKVTK